MLPIVHLLSANGEETRVRLTIYANECTSRKIVEGLRVFGYDIQTALEAGNANQGISDEDVLAYALEEGLVVLSNNTRHFRKLHRQGTDHAGIISFTLPKTSDDIPKLIKQISNAILAIAADRNSMERAGVRQYAHCNQSQFTME